METVITKKTINVIFKK